MSNRVQISVPLNRVEGDLEIFVELDRGVVADAKSCGSMYRGFENILLGRGSLDGLVITPRICGICSTAHLSAACMALEDVIGLTPPSDAVRMRNLALMTEIVQSDVRHAFLMFAPDFTNNTYKDAPLYEEACKRFLPFKGQAVIETLQETKKVLGIVAAVGGQWPHSSYMVPGGIVSMPTEGDIVRCRMLLKAYRTWYEDRVLGCSLSRWKEIDSEEGLFAWLRESPSHANSHMGLLIRLAKDVGMQGMGVGYGNFISFGSFTLPEDTAAAPFSSGGSLFRPGFAQGVTVADLNPTAILEDVSHSWFQADQVTAHPAQGQTKPYACGEEGGRYSWAKAPRYNGVPAETGPLATMVVNAIPLYADYVGSHGPDVFIREIARLARPALLLPVMDLWLAETSEMGSFYTPCETEGLTGSGAGLLDVTRGALGHWIGLEDGKITHYQIITPTAWNGSPRDASGLRGPWEEALVGVEVRDSEDPVEVGHVVRSFDACLVCTVHCLNGSQAIVGQGVD